MTHGRSRMLVHGGGLEDKVLGQTNEKDNQHHGILRKRICCEVCEPCSGHVEPAAEFRRPQEHVLWIRTFETFLQSEGYAREHSLSDY